MTKDRFKGFMKFLNVVDENLGFGMEVLEWYLNFVHNSPVKVIKILRRFLWMFLKLTKRF